MEFLSDKLLALMNIWAEPEYNAAFKYLSQHLLSEETEDVILQAGFHSAQSEDLGSTREVQRFYQAQHLASQYLKPVTYNAPPMVLPGIKVVRTIKQQWKNVEKPADVCFVVDISDSMNGHDKLTKVKSGIQDFLDRFKSPESRVSLVTFASSAQKDIPLIPLPTNRAQVERAINRLSTDGMTALFDAVLLAVDELDNQGASSHIQAIIALTDGQENKSRSNIDEVLQALSQHENIAFYGIAYGDDAERRDLEKMAYATNGLVVESSPAGIQQLFQQLATRV